MPRQLTPLAALLLAALAGCAAGSGLTSYSSSTYEASASPLNDAQKALTRNDYFRASRAFEQAAAEAGPPQNYEYHLRAAEAATDGNDYSYAGGILDALPLSTLDPQQQLRWRLLRARAALARNDAAGALHLLPENAGNSPLSERVLLLRGRALFRLNDPVGATQALVQREHLLDAPALVSENHDAIWSGLAAAPLDAAALARASNADPVTRGWIELANLAHRNASLEMYESWRQRYPGHPAQDRLAGAMMTGTPQAPQSGPAPAYVTPPPGSAPAFNSVPARPGFYALLLPQSGNLAAYADSVHSGFAAAAARAGNRRPTCASTTPAIPARRSTPTARRSATAPG